MMMMIMMMRGISIRHRLQQSSRIYEPKWTDEDGIVDDAVPFLLFAAHTSAGEEAFKETGPELEIGLIWVTSLLPARSDFSLNVRSL